MPVSFGPIGNPELIGGAGYKAPSGIPVVSVRGGFWNGNILHGLVTPITLGQAQTISLTTGANQELLAAVAAEYWLIDMLVVSLGTAGKVEFREGSTAFLILDLPANQSFAVPIPDSGLVSAVDNTALNLHNPQSGTVAITYNLMYRYY